MATKRTIDAVHPSRRDQVSRKRQKPDNLGAKSFKKAHPVNAVKTRLRDIKRLLAKADLPADVRVAKERELQSTQHELDKTQAGERRSKMIMKYHQVRFFDRQKATKRLRKAQKSLRQMLRDGSAESEVADVQRQVDEADIDVAYAIYYPLEKPYSSLFPKSRTEDDEAPRGDHEIRELVRTCLADGRLQDLRDGKLTGGKEADKILRKDTKTKAAPVLEAEEDEEDGFFE